MDRDKIGSSVTVLALLLIIAAAGCSIFGPESGTILIEITGAAEHDGKQFYYTVIAEDNGCTGKASQVDGQQSYSGSMELVNGSAYAVVKDIAGIPVVFDGGYILTLTGYIDVDDSGGPPVGGLDYVLGNQREYFVDGSHTFHLAYPGDFSLCDDGSAAMVLFLDGEQVWNYIDVDFDNGYLKFPREYECIIENRGGALLRFTGTPKVTLSGSTSSLFSIVSQPADTTLMPGESTSFIIRTNPVTAGLYRASITIPYNSPDGAACTAAVKQEVFAPVLELPRTGQGESSAAGDDGNLQAGMEWPDVRFTDNGDGTVTDHLTGLMWQGEPPYSTYSPQGYTWDYAVYNYAETKNSANYCGYSDWHIPNINELMSITHTGEISTAGWLNSFSGFTGIRGDRYWSSTRMYSSGGNSFMGCMVYLDDGALWRLSINAISFARIIIVRESGTPGVISLPRTGKDGGSYATEDGVLQLGEPWPSPRFIIGEGIVYDALTGLQWKQDPYGGTLTWADAVSYAYNLDYAGYDDWRLPNRNELRSLVSYGRNSNDPYLAAFFETTVPELRYWWTSTTYPSQYGDGKAWVVYLNTGTSDGLVKTESHNCWVVRGP